MARPRTSKHWDHPKYKRCYVREFRGGAATVVFSSYPMQTGLKFVPAAKEEAMAILNRRIEEHRLKEAGVLSKAIAIPKGVMTVGALFDDFLMCSVKISDKRRKRIAKEMGHTPLNELATNTLAITEYILASLDSMGNGVNTQRNSLKAIRQVFAFGVERGHITVNPIPTRIIPDEEKENEPDPYTDTQIKRIHRLYDGGRTEAYLRFLEDSACRAGEATSLEWAEVYPTYCRVYSLKGSGKKIWRIIPFSVCPDAKLAIDMMRPDPDPMTGEVKLEGKVFGMNNYTGVAEKVRDILGNENRGLKAIRSWRINVWKREKIPVWVRTAIAGHSEKIAEKYYETKWTADELTKEVQSAARNLQEKNGTKQHKKTPHAA